MQPWWLGGFPSVPRLFVRRWQYLVWWGC